MQSKVIYLWFLRLLAAAILVQTLYFKFTGSPESVYIFSTLGIEPVGRIGSGIAELVAAILLLIPRFNVYGALLASGTMMGAILSHLTILGVEVMNDGGLLFALALIVLICSGLLLLHYKKEVMRLPILNRIFPSPQN
ncbi:MAG: DoxX family protein [Flavobacteriales bacterium]